MAPRHARSARAMAPTTWWAGFPLALRWRERCPRRSWAFQLSAWIGVDTFSRRQGRCRLPVAGEREAQAPSTRARRAWRWPVWVLPPWRRRSPVEYADGVTPRACLSWRGGSNRVRAPSAAPVGTATGPCPPRRAWSASTTGASRQGCPWSVRAWSRRASRAVWSGTARRYAGHPLCCAGVGQTTALSHRRGAGPQVARPGSRRACRRSKALSRHGAVVRARRASVRARPRSRIAASSPWGTETGVRSPERLRRASVMASRRWVVTRSPGFWGLKEGATTPQTWPVWVRER